MENPHEYRKTVSLDIHNQLHDGDDYQWIEAYKDYYHYDPRVVNIFRIEDRVIVMERLEGFTLDNTAELEQLDLAKKRYILNEAFDIYNKQFHFKSAILGTTEIWAHNDFNVQNLMWCKGKVRLIDPEAFSKRNLKIKSNSIHYGKFFETYITLMLDL